jgi:hypothetical protein
MARKALGHTATHKGRTVRIVLRDGSTFSGRFLGRTDKWVVIEGRGRVWKCDIKSFICVKGYHGPQGQQ